MIGWIKRLFGGKPKVVAPKALTIPEEAAILETFATLDITPTTEDLEWARALWQQGARVPTLKRLIPIRLDALAKAEAEARAEAER